MISSNELIKKRILITGANGLLGQRLVLFYYKQPRIQVLATSLAEKPVNKDVDYISCDITNREQFKKYALDFYPDIIINAAAFNDIEKCESDRENAWKVNVKAVEYITEVSRVMDSHIIHFSTDHIFDGTRGPYSEKAKPNPLSYFARTKLASENVLRLGGVNYTLVRSTLLFGINKNGKPDFIKRLVDSLKSNQYFEMSSDQYNNPTYTDDLVQAVSKIIEFKKQGIYNVGGGEQISYYNFAKKITEVFSLDSNFLRPVLTKDISLIARYPLTSGFVIIKSQTELGYKPYTINEALSLIKKEFHL